VRNPFNSQLWRKPTFARVWTAAIVVEVERDQPVGG
jgi:hypothetical protein